VKSWELRPVQFAGKGRDENSWKNLVGNPAKKRVIGVGG